MKCPVDGAELVMTERQGVEIDHCPTCRGVWLDRGELDKILDRSVRIGEQTGAGYGDLRPGEHRPGPARNEDRPPEPRRDERGGDPRYHRRRKGSWLGELFDF